MTWMWTMLAGLVLIVWVITLVDVFRRHYSGWTMVGYIVLIVLLPFIGSVIYWLVRRPTAAETEQAYLAQADMRHRAASRSFDP